MSFRISFNQIRYAEKGDIVISRVGSRCVGNIAYIEYGRIPITDCVFVLKASNSHKLWKLIKSFNISARLKASSLGVGAKYITIKTLEETFNG